MKENEATVEVEGRKVHIVDLPGSNSLRYKLKQFLHNTSKIVFVVDSSDVTKTVQDISQFLYELFTNKIVNRNQIPILVCCNKQDYIIATEKEKIQEKLTQEIETLRVTKTETPSAHEAGEETLELNVKGKKFTFGDAPSTVTFIETSLLKGTNMDQIKKFIFNK